MSCVECVHFDQMGEDRKTGQKYGMCRSWNFSINENDDRGCKRKTWAEPRAPRKEVDTTTREGFPHA